MFESKQDKCNRGAQKYGSKVNAFSSVKEVPAEGDCKCVECKKQMKQGEQIMISGGNIYCCEACLQKGMRQDSKENGYSTTARDKSYIQALTAGWNVTEASDASYFGTKKWFADFISGEVGVDRDIVHVNLGTKGFVTLEPRR